MSSSFRNVIGTRAPSHMRRADRPRKHLSAPRKGKRISRPLAERVSDAISRCRAGCSSLSCSEWRPGRRRPRERRAPAGPLLGAICPIKLHELALARSELLGVPKKYRNEAPPSEDTFWGKARRRGESCIRPAPRGSLSEFDRSVCLTRYHAAECACRAGLFSPCGRLGSECSRRASDKEDHTDADRSVLLVHDCLRSVCLTQYHAAECAQITLPLTTTMGYDS